MFEQVGRYSYPEKLPTVITVAGPPLPANAADAASDVFSLGAMAYLVLTGQPPGNTLAERAALLSSGRLSVAAAPVIANLRTIPIPDLLGSGRACMPLPTA